MSAISRRRAILALGAGAALSRLSRPAFAQQIEVSTEMILRDPAAPVGGNPQGDLAIVNYTDYNCPYCKKVAPILAQIVKEDGKIRLVYKDWPVIRPTSVEGAILALAAHRQGKYEVAHQAMMRIPGSGISKEQMREALQKAGIDMRRLDADTDKHRDAILALIKRNMAQGDALGLTGTPAFLVGPFRTSTLDYNGFKQIVADARAKQAQER